MTIIRNSAKCIYCYAQIVSTHRHDFAVHVCKVHPQPGLKWEGDKLVPSGEITFNFAVDGGKAYIRRAGTGYIDTSIYEEDKKEEDHTAQEQDSDTGQVNAARREAGRNKAKRPKVAG